MKQTTLTLIITAVIFSISFAANAQTFTFAMIETTVTSDEIPTDELNPTERRFYVSNVVEMPGNLRSYQLNKIADDYFTANVVEPFKAKGIKIHYYENDLKLDCGSVIAAKNKQDAETKRMQCVEDLKERGRVSIYSFTWTFADSNGLETALPIIIFQSKDSPSYQPKSEKTISPKTTETTPVSTPKTGKKVKKPRKN